MTRFARAHGSKASNERHPEEATSWIVLKQQLLEQQAESKNRAEEASRPKPAKQPFVFQANKSETTEWAEFEETPSAPKHQKKNTKLQLSEEKLLDRSAQEEQHSSKTKLHKIKTCIDDNTGKKLTKKVKKNKEKELQNLHSDVVENLETVTIKPKDELQVKISKREKRKNKLTVLEKSMETFRPSHDSEGANSELKTPQYSSKTKLHESKTCVDDNTGKKLTKKVKKIKEKELQNLHSDVEDLGTVAIKPKDELQVKISKREKRKNKLKVLEKPIKSFSHDSRETNSELKTSEVVDGSERPLSKRQLKRKKHLLKKLQDDGFVSKRLKVEGVNKPTPTLAKTSMNGNDVNKGEPKLSKQQKDKRRSQLQEQQTSNLINTPTNKETLPTDGQSPTQTNTKFQAQSKRQKRNLKKLGDPTRVNQRKRRKPYAQSTTMVINGQEIEVTMLDGFPVRKEDADRLKELRKQMIDNGIPSTEIDETMKLERRKAEKALARERRKVCFHCRKGGHNLSECPEVNEGSNQDAAGSGICFKCGSTEHTHFQCRVVRGQEFRFAKCFICQEQGHISRQCPDNPRGLYPKGGGCKVCGDVTHLKKDCPDLHEKKEQNVITLDTARSDRLEALDEDLRLEERRPVVDAPKNKIIKFY